MADISIPQFAVTASLQQRIPTQILVEDNSNYLTENRADYYLMGVATRLLDDGILLITADSVDPTVVSQWQVDTDEDGVIQTFLIYALLYGQEAVTGNFIKGSITYYMGAFYIAIADITGSTNPSLSTGVDANFKVLSSSNWVTYVGISLYHVVENWLVQERGSLCIHLDRKDLLAGYVPGSCLGPPRSMSIIAKRNYLQAAVTGMSVPEIYESDKWIRTLNDICDGC